MFAATPFFEALGWTLLAAFAVLTLAFVASIVTKRNSVADIAWGLAFIAVAVVATVLSAGHGETARRLLVLGMVVVWGGRLALFIGWRNRGKGEDPRYAEMLAKGGGHPVLKAYLKVFALQSVIAWFVAIPVVISAFNRGGLTVLAYVGVAIWAVGVFFEAVGDQQLLAFKSKPSSKGKTMDSGLWRYTRHPNYFGDACVWTGIFLVAAEHLPGVATILSPVAMVLLLTRGSGKPITERKMAKEKPDFADYVARTSGFFPLPPKKHVTDADRQKVTHG
jgi:steroid 5-alpha reductase family enzyme